jgi:hypothetical protein
MVNVTEVRNIRMVQTKWRKSVCFVLNNAKSTGARYTKTKHAEMTSVKGFTLRIP